MGIVVSKCYAKHLTEPRELRARISLLEVEKLHKEASFSIENRKQKEEMVRLRRKVEEEEENVKRLKAAAIVGCRYHGWQLEKDYFDYMKKEQRRKEAVEKWKQLYLAIKMELDELIRRTKGLMTQGLLRELKAKDEALEAFRAKLAAMEKEGA